MSIKQLLFVASSSPYQLERTQALQNLVQKQNQNQELFFQELFYLLCSHQKTIHILAFSYFKQLLIQSLKHKFANLNSNFQKAYFYWEAQNLQRSNINQIFNLQRQNIIEIASRYYSLNSSSRFRQSFISQIPFKLIEKFQIKDLKSLQSYLKYYSKIIQNLLLSQTAKIMSRKNMMGALMLNKIIPVLQSQNIYINSLWVNFFVYYGRYCDWTPDKNYLISALNKFKLSKSTIIALSQFLVDKVQPYCSLQDSCRILTGLQKTINLIKSNISNFTGNETQIILKSYRGFLYHIFCSNFSISEQNEVMCIQFIRSYQNFQNILSFIIKVIQFYTLSCQQIQENVSPMLIQYSTQIISVYSEYFQNEQMISYINEFKSTFETDKYFQNMLVLLSGMPKTILELFNYEEVIFKLLSKQIFLKQGYQIIYLNFISRFIGVNTFLEQEIIEKICFYLIENIKNHQRKIQIHKNSQNLVNQIRKKIDQQQLLICQTLNILSKISKFKYFCIKNQNYFPYVCQNLFNQLLYDSNFLSLIPQSFNFLIKQQIKQWNNFILLNSIEKMFIFMKENEMNSNKQKIIQLYRICKKTMNIEHLVEIKYLQNKNTSINCLVDLCILNNKDQVLKEEILFNLEEILLQINIFNKKYTQNSAIIQEILQSFVTSNTFQQIYQIFQSTCYLQQMEIGDFQKVEFKQEEYLILPQKLCNNFQLHTCCIKIFIQLIPYKQYLEKVIIFLTKSKSQYLNCLWEALYILYDQQINDTLVPEGIKQRVNKMKNGNIIELFQRIGLNQSKGFKLNTKNVEWFQLYRQIVSEKSVVNQLISNRINSFNN